MADAVVVVIPARNAETTIGATLDALATQDLDDAFAVVVVDDASSDATAEVAERHPLGLVVRHATPLGAGASRNEGAAVLEADVVAFTDADCVPSPQWLSSALAALETADVVQGQVLPVPGVPVGPWDRTLAVTAAWGLYESANLVVRREWLERVGGFDEWLKIGGRPFAEDVWLGWRLRRAGARMAFVPEALVHHAVFPGRAADWLRERWRDGHFAAVAARIPELRDVFFYRRWFLSPRSAAFDLALAGLLTAPRARPLALAALPYARAVRAETRRFPRHSAWRIAAVTVAGDAVGFASLVRGSVRTRTLLL